MIHICSNFEYIHEAIWLGRDQHQQHNAKPVVEAGGALLAEDKVDPEANCLCLGTPLARLLEDPLARAQMKLVLDEMSSADGATEVVRALLDIAPG